MGFLAKRALSLVFFLILALMPAHGLSREVNWPVIKPTGILLVYPGTTSWEFVLSDDHRLGSGAIKRNMSKDCRHCHLSKEGELDMKVDEIASGEMRMKLSHKPFEPEPIAGKKGTMHAGIQAAYDDEFVYLKIQWNSVGTGWRSEERPDRVSLQVNKENPAFAKYGCFITCHNDLNTMPSSPSGDEVRSDPYYKPLERDDVRLYAYYTRDAWNKRKGTKELDEKLATGLIDLWSVELTSGSARPHDGWIFDDRRWEKETEVEASGEWAAGRYTVVIKRKLAPGGRYNIDIKDGDVITVGLAIHDDGVEKRKHYVSFPFTIGLGTEADVRAVKITD